MSDKIRHSARPKFVKQRIGELRQARLDPTEILRHIEEENALRCDPPLTTQEIQALVLESNIILDAQKKELKYTDRYNATYFKKCVGEDLFFCEKLGGWHYWDEKLWRRDETERILEYGGKVLDKMIEDAQNSGNETFIKHVKSSSSKGKITAMIDLARGERMARTIETIDADDLLLNCANGTFNLKEMKLQDFSRYDFITRITKAAYDPTAPRDKWIKFLNEIFLNDQDLINYMQKVIGYAVTGLTREQCMWVFYGNGMNGKGKFLTALQEVLGDYANELPPSELILKHNESISNEIARLRASRFLTASESGQSKSFDEAKVKRLTGEERMSARFLFQESFEFYFKGKIFFMTNHKPEIRGYDKGIWRRIKPIPFDLDLKEDQIDKDILEKLLLEKDGILTWCIEGYQKYKEEGLKEPRRVIEALIEYKEESDKFSEFIESHCVVGESFDVGVSEILQSANEWSKELGFKVRRNDFSDFLKKKGFEKVKKSKGWVWVGIGLSVATEPEINFSERPF